MTSNAEPGRGRAGAVLKLALSIALSAFFLWLAFASLGGCPDELECSQGACVEPGDDPNVVCADDAVCVTCIDWADLPGQLGDVDPVALVIFTLITFAVHAIRIGRWYFMLRPLGLRRLWLAVRAGAIGFAAIVIVPLRLGELVRPYVIARETGGRIGMSAALGTAVVERVSDGLVVTGLLFVMLLSLPISGTSPAAVWTAGGISAVVFVSATVVILLSWFRRGPTLRFLESVGNRISEALTRKALGLLEGFLDGMATLRRAGKDLNGFAVMTLLYWALNAYSMQYLAGEFGFDITYLEAVAVMSILVIGIMVPGAPGHIGTYEFFFMAGLSLYADVASDPLGAVAFVATIHMLQFLVQVVSGVPFLLTSGISLRRAISSSEAELESSGSDSRENGP